MIKSFHKGCCKDETTQLKVGDQKVANASLSIEKLISPCLIPVFGYIETVQISSITERNPLINAPPFIDGIPLFIRYQDFRI